MKKILLSFATALFIIGCGSAPKTEQLRNDVGVHLDLIQVKDDKVKVTVTAPTIQEAEIVYHLPKIIPGTYSEDDYGKMIEEVKAFDKDGNPLTVTTLDKNIKVFAQVNHLDIHPLDEVTYLKIARELQPFYDGLWEAKLQKDWKEDYRKLSLITRKKYGLDEVTRDWNARRYSKTKYEEMIAYLEGNSDWLWLDELKDHQRKNLPALPPAREKRNSQTVAWLRQRRFLLRTPSRRWQITSRTRWNSLTRGTVSANYANK